MPHALIRLALQLLGCSFLLLGIQKLLGSGHRNEHGAGHSQCDPVVGLLRKAGAQANEIKKGTALYNMGSKGTVLCRVTRAIAGPICIHRGKEWAFLAVSSLLT